MFIQVQKSKILRPESILPAPVAAMFDSVSSRYVSEELLALETTAYKYVGAPVLFPQMFNVTNAGAGKESVGYVQQTQWGQAQFGSRGQTNIEPGGTTRRRYTRPILPIFSSYVLDWKDQEIGSVVGFNVDADEAMAAKDRNFATLDIASISGGANDELEEIKGILHFCNGGLAADNSIPKVTMTAWSGATGKEIYEQVSNAIEAVYNNSKGKAICRKVAMGFQARAYLHSEWVETTAGAGVQTVWKALQETYGNQVTFLFNPLLDDVTFTGAPDETFSDAGVILAYDDNPLYHNFEVPQLFRILRPYKYNGGLSMEVQCLSECAGLAIKLLPAFAYGKGHT